MSRLLTQHYENNLLILRIRITLNNIKIFDFFFLIILAKKLAKDVNKTGVFACNELNLEDIQVYGFDYDYTLACYKQSLHFLLYGLGRDMLVNKYKVFKILC